MTAIAVMLSEIDLTDMNNLCRINCAGLCPVPKLWIPTVALDVNRLYYIHSGIGGYISDDGTRKIMQPGLLYLIPGIAKVSTWSDESSELVHTYANFELIPPILTNRVLSINPSLDAKVLSALNVFNTVSEEITNKKISLFSNNTGEIEFLSSAVRYLVSKMTDQPDVDVLNDEIVLKALQVIHSNISDKLSVSMLAAQCFMSEDGFIRKFAGFMGQTPYAYIKSLRIRTASYMRELGYTWEHIASSTGYSDAAALLHALNNTQNSGEKHEKG